MYLFCFSLESLEVHKDITDDYNRYRLQMVNITYGDKQVERGKIRVSCTMFVCFVCFLKTNVLSQDHVQDLIAFIQQINHSGVHSQEQ